MKDLAMFAYVAFGVVVAVIFPVLVRLIRAEFPPTFRGSLAPWLRRYVLLCLFSLVTALVVLAIYKAGGGKDLLWYTAFLLGFSWESTIEKFQRPEKA
jgi:hypothetical protein